MLNVYDHTECSNAPFFPQQNVEQFYLQLILWYEESNLLSNMQYS